MSDSVLLDCGSAVLAPVDFLRHAFSRNNDALLVTNGTEVRLATPTSGEAEAAFDSFPLVFRAPCSSIECRVVALALSSSALTSAVATTSQELFVIIGPEQAVLVEWKFSQPIREVLFSTHHLIVRTSSTIELCPLPISSTSTTRSLPIVSAAVAAFGAVIALASSSLLQIFVPELSMEEAKVVIASPDIVRLHFIDESSLITISQQSTTASLFSSSTISTNALLSPLDNLKSIGDNLRGDELNRFSVSTWLIGDVLKEISSCTSSVFLPNIDISAMHPNSKVLALASSSGSRLLFMKVLNSGLELLHERSFDADDAESRIRGLNFDGSGNALLYLASRSSKEVSQPIFRSRWTPFQAKILRLQGDPICSDDNQNKLDQLVQLIESFRSEVLTRLDGLDRRLLKAGL